MYVSISKRRKMLALSDIKLYNSFINQIHIIIDVRGEQMELRKDFIDSFADILQDKNVSVLNIYGDSGMGKTHVIKQITGDPMIGSKMISGLIDISRFESMSEKSVTENLYAICDILTSCSKFEPLRFCIADAIDSKRCSRTSYTERMAAKNSRPAAQNETLTDIKELTSIFFDLSSLDDVLTIWNITKKYYNKFKPHSPAERKMFKQFETLDEQELRQMLPQTLADDINSFDIDENKRIVIFVDNFDRLRDFTLKGSWLDTLIEKARDVLWVFVSRNKMTIDHPRVKYKLLDGIQDPKMDKYLLDNGIDDKSRRERIIKMCNGSPFYANKILEMVKSSCGMTEDDWNTIEQRGINGIARTFIDHTDPVKRELLYILSNAEDFDAGTFEQLFPERIFNINKAWFSSSMFDSIENGVYSVQNSTRDIILAYLNNTDSTINRECRRKLFEAEFSLLDKYSESTAEHTEISLSRHLSDMCRYAEDLNNNDRFFDALIRLKTLFIRCSEINLYYESMTKISGQCSDSADIKIKAMFEIASLDYLRGYYRRAEDIAAKGYELAHSSNNALIAMKFLTIRMDIADIAPSDTENAAQQMADLAEKYIGLTETLRTALSYKQYITNKMTAHIYAARAYTIKENHQKANKYLDFIFDICSDERKMSSLSLYGICARAYEVKGNMHGTSRSDKETNLILRKAVDMYDIAEAQQKIWNTEFQINCAKAHKRLAENCLKLSDYENGIEQCENALARYNIIKRNYPDNIVVYCNTCFTLTDCAHYLIDYNEELAEKYLNRAIRTADEALEILNSGYNDNPNGNRQLCNARCIANRNRGEIMEKHNDIVQAENFYRNALSAAEDSIRTAPAHPYGYYEYATTCEKLTELFRSQGRYAEAADFALRGRESILESRKYTDNPNSFGELFELLSV